MQKRLRAKKQINNGQDLRCVHMFVLFFRTTPLTEQTSSHEMKKKNRLHRIAHVPPECTLQGWRKKHVLVCLHSLEQSFLRKVIKYENLWETAFFFAENPNHMVRSTELVIMVAATDSVRAGREGAKSCSVFFIFALGHHTCINCSLTIRATFPCSSASSQMTRQCPPLTDL